MVGEQLKRRRTSAEVLKTCSVESLHVFEINEDGYSMFLVSDSHKLEVLSMFCFLTLPASDLRQALIYAQRAHC